MSELAAADFPAFFEAVYGCRPFPWQNRLATQVVETGEWPELLDLPTGTGKTAALDVALFALAVRGNLPRRIVFVVDRRIVVHQAAQRVRSLVQRLDDKAAGVTGEVARRLRALAPPPPGVETGPVVRWSELRGGIVRDEGWATRPDVPAVLVSTVDQVGSRLLFRGYGVSRGMRPIHAGLLGSDTLFLLDEVHLARPFSKTLQAIRTRYRRGDGTSGLPDRWTIVELSATPSEVVEAPFRIIAADRYPADERDVRAAAELAQRLEAHKPARLHEVPTGATATKQGEAIAKACVAEVVSLLDAGVRTVGVIVNRVATAARVHQELCNRRHDAILVTGRMRPIDRDEAVRRLERRAGTGRARSDDQPPVVVVATQAIEAGADLDLDAVVTECASLDALRQRFGRVDRTGIVSATGAPPISAVLGGSNAVAPGAEDPVYGPALASTWAWLSSTASDGVVDFGISYLSEPDATTREAVLPPQPWCPQLLPGHLDRWVQTSTLPHADPVVGHWLHGLEERPADVSVIWRADVTPELLAWVAHDDPDGDGAPSPAARTDVLDDLLETCPPDAREAMDLPAVAVRQWLATVAGGEALPVGEPVADAPMTMDPAPKSRPDQIAPVVLIAHGEAPGPSTVTDGPKAIAPGATIVVPCAYGGITGGSWDPSSTVAVVDRASAARALADRRAVVRIVDGGLPLVGEEGRGLGRVPEAPALEQFDDDVDDATIREADRDAALGWLGEYLERSGQPDAGGEDGAPQPEVVVARHLARGRVYVRRQFLGYGPLESQPRGCLVVTSGRRIREHELGGRDGESYGAPVDSEPATSSFLGREVGLTQHLGDVRCWVERLARNVGLPGHLIGDLALAGWMHDLGKADPRFQTMLRQGVVAGSSSLLAKSALGPGDRRARRRAQEASGYPRGMRHELLSVALVQHRDDVMADAHDPDLVLHLVASHHGYCRPFAPVVVDPAPLDVALTHDGFELRAGSAHGLARLDSGVSERFWRLVRRYGWWGLAWLEALLRLADHRASEAEQRSSESEDAAP